MVKTCTAGEADAQATTVQQPGHAVGWRQHLKMTCLLRLVMLLLLLLLLPLLGLQGAAVAGAGAALCRRSVRHLRPVFNSSFWFALLRRGLFLGVLSLGRCTQQAASSRRRKPGATV